MSDNLTWEGFGYVLGWAKVIKQAQIRQAFIEIGKVAELQMKLIGSHVAVAPDVVFAVEDVGPINFARPDSEKLLYPIPEHGIYIMYFYVVDTNTVVFLRYRREGAK